MIEGIAFVVVVAVIVVFIAVCYKIDIMHQELEEMDRTDDFLKPWDGSATSRQNRERKETYDCCKSDSD